MIFTFYSYKGGVGRTMALANIAELFYEHGYSVLMVDWDLEAPGLERFFPNSNERVKEQLGIIDMLREYKKVMAQSTTTSADIASLLSSDNIEKYLVSIYRTTSDGASLRLLSAGRRSGSFFAKYANAVLTFDWTDFYQNWEGERYFEWLRKQLGQMADVVLIDSRTGVTEMGGVCTYHLADVVIMLCAPNEQNLQGTFKMAQNFMAPSTQEARGGRPLKVLVVPARVEQFSEVDLLEDFQRKFNLDVKTLASESKGLLTDQLWEFNIPYIPKYAFIETVAVRQGIEKAGSSAMVKSFEALFRLLEQELSPQTKTLEHKPEIDAYPAEVDFTIPPTGTLSYGDSRYIERSGVDDVAHQAIHNQTRTTLTIIGPRQSGKSSLIEQLRGLSKDKEVVLIDFQELKLPDDFDAFLQQFCALFGEKLDVPDINTSITRIWDSYLPAPRKCTKYVTEELRRGVNRPICLALDEIDALRDQSYAIDFFRMLRSWHNKGQSKQEPTLAKLSLVLSIATPPYLLIPNLNESPFNVGTTVQLRDFEQDEIRGLFQQYGGADEQVFDAVFELLAGHPFLTQQVFYYVFHQGASLDKLIKQTIDRIGPLAPHFQWVEEQIHRDSAKREMLQTILRQETTPKINDTLDHLSAQGIVTRIGHQYQIRNPLYQKYFEQWLI